MLRVGGLTVLEVQKTRIQHFYTSGTRDLGEYRTADQEQYRKASPFDWAGTELSQGWQSILLPTSYHPSVWYSGRCHVWVESWRLALLALDYPVKIVANWPENILFDDSINDRLFWRTRRKWIWRSSSDSSLYDSDHHSFIFVSER